MKVEQNVSLLPYNNLKVNIKTKYFVEIKTPQEVIDFLKDPNYKKLPYYILGLGCNIFFTKDYPGVILKVDIKGKEIVAEDKKFVTIKLGAGEDWIELVDWAVKKNYAGIENLAFIPSSLGGAAIQNIAAYGQVFEDCFVELEAINMKTGKLETFSKKRMQYKYRDSILKDEWNNDYFVISVTIKLKKGGSADTTYWSYKHSSIEAELEKEGKKPPYTIQDVHAIITKMRKEKFPYPSKRGTTGSFFINPFVTKEKLKEIAKKIPNIQYYPVTKMQYPKNVAPGKVKSDYVKIAGGMLIDQGLGWLGKRVGTVQIHPHHGITLISDPKTDPQDVLKLVKLIQDAVLDEFGVKLGLEVKKV